MAHTHAHTYTHTRAYTGTHSHTHSALKLIANGWQNVHNINEADRWLNSSPNSAGSRLPRQVCVARGREEMEGERMFHGRRLSSGGR